MLDSRVIGGNQIPEPVDLIMTLHLLVDQDSVLLYACIDSQRNGLNHFQIVRQVLYVEILLSRTKCIQYVDMCQQIVDII